MSKVSRVRLTGLHALAVLVPVLALMLTGSNASAALWRTGGLPVDSANTAQANLCTVSDGRNGLIAVWSDSLSNTPAVRCQRVDSTGAIQWNLNGIILRESAAGVQELVAASDGAGGVLVAWTDRSSFNQRRVRAQRVDASGTVIWTPGGVILNAATNDTLQHSPSIDADGAAGAIVAWAELRSGAPKERTYVQRLAGGNGSASWTLNGVDVGGSAGSDQLQPRVIGDARGGAWVQWLEVGGSTSTNFQRFGANGLVSWGLATPTTIAEDNVVTTRVVENAVPTDTLFFAYTGAASKIQGNFLLEDGSLRFTSNPPELAVSLTPLVLVSQATGGALLVYSTGAPNGQLHARLISDAGVPGTDVTLLSGLPDAAGPVRAVSDGLDGLYAVWSKSGIAYAHHLTASATFGWAAAESLAVGITSTQTHPEAVPGTDLIAAWLDNRAAATTRDDIFAQRVSPTGVRGSYFRVRATVGAGAGTFSQGGGLTYVRQGDSLRVKFTGTAQRISNVVVRNGSGVGGASLGPIPAYTFHDIAADSTLQASFSASPVTQQASMSGTVFKDFSIPVVLPFPSPDSVFKALMPYSTTRWRLGHWAPDDSVYEEPGHGLESITAGNGYWFRMTKDTTLSFSGVPVTEQQFDVDMLGRTGSKGWTQFGHPFRFPVMVSQLRLSNIPSLPITDPANVYTDHEVVEWDPVTSTYPPAGVLYPGHVYWLYKKSPSAVTLRIPFDWYPLPAAPVPGLSVRGDWSVRITASAGASRAGLEVGAANVLAGRWNGLSSHALPAGPGDVMRLALRTEDWGEDNDRYRAVFRPDAASLTWDFDATGPAGLTQATFAFAFDRLPNGRQVTLSEPASGWSRTITAGAVVPLVLSGAARTFRIVVSSGAPDSPRAPATSLRALGPNPTRNTTTMWFVLDRPGALRWSVYDVSGRRVASESRMLAGGEYAASWAGLDAGGRRVAPGLYLVRWEANGRSGSARLLRIE